MKVDSKAALAFAVVEFEEFEYLLGVWTLSCKRQILSKQGSSCLLSSAISKRLKKGWN